MSQRGVVAVAGDQAVHVRPARVVQVDRIDNQRKIGRVLPLHRIGLLNRPDPTTAQRGIPRLQCGLEPVAVRATNRDLSMFRERCQNPIQAAQRGIVGIDQKCNGG